MGKPTVAVLGAGSWGTTLARVFAHAGTPVTIWARREALAQEINERHTNATYLEGTSLPTNIRATTCAREALEGATFVVLAVPSQTLRDNLSEWKDSIEPDATVVSLAKGIERGTLYRMSEVIAEVAGIEPERIAVLSGPNLAREIAEEQPATTVLACEHEPTAVRIQHALATSYFRPYTNDDVVGCEIGGACKNVIALACGMVAGCGYGENTAASVITRGLAEITRLGVALGAHPQTFAGLAGLGDLVATCSSPLSRNRTFGERLGAGASLDDAKKATKGQVAEGVWSSESVCKLAESLGVEMPISQAVYQVCHEGHEVADMVQALMERSKKSEVLRAGYTPST